MLIKKIKRGKKEYYYLEHSIRKKDKIIKKQKYLGTRIPNNIEEIKYDFTRELRSEIYKKIKKIKDNFQKEWKSIPESVKEKELEEIAIAFTYNTNAIEGSTITLEETREIIHDKIAPNKPLKDIKETEAHSKIFLEMLKKKEKITNQLLLRWHHEIFKDAKPDISGKYRDYLVRVGDYRAPDWQDVKKLMLQIIKFISNSEKINPIELASIVHYRFEKVHPFGDGNGRIGRLIMNHILWYKDYPMLIIEYKNRRAYYKALSKSEESFTNYFIKRYVAVHKRRLKE